MKLSVLVVLIAATAVLAEDYFAETPIEAGLRRRPKIVGGREAVPHSIPFQVGLILSGMFCGGSLITKRYVLTAAHCGVRTQNPTVILGAHQVREKEPEQTVMTGKRVKTHEQYVKRTLRNDISLIELPEEAPINQYIKLIKLTSPNGGLYVGATAQASGWGLAYDGAPGISPVLRVVESTIITNSECQRKFGPGIQVFPTVLCLDGSKKKSTCNGDSGGPLVVKNGNELIQVGVVSYGSSAGCEKGFPAGFTRLTSYIDWIQNNSDYK